MYPDMNTNHTILDVLCARAAELPDRAAYHLLSDDGAEAGQMTWGELDRRARTLGAHLAGMNARGERAILLYPSGLDYIVALYACFYAGVIAVPAYPPRANRHLSRILAIVEDCAPKYVLTHSSVIRDFPALQNLQWIATDTLDLVEDSAWAPAPAPDNAPAFLQYTSGSTSSPKGVIVTHANLQRNLDLIGKGFGVDERSVIVSWLPMYHDMGLIGNILATGWLGAECYVMSPAAFVRRPAIWLQAISRFGATASGGPNFAYDLCVQKVSEEECAGLDLSRWHTAFNGAEPIRAETMRRFAAKFQRHGFRSRAFFPCYGLAESTLFVAGGRTQRAHVDRVAIVNPKTRLECAPGETGEIWVSDASVAAGYWGRPSQSAETFGARLARTNEGPFLRTGDLGAVNGGELSVMGRLKELIIIRGRNLYPHDLEATAEAASAALSPRGVIAFGVEREREERLVLVAEVAREHRSRVKVDEAGEAVRRAIAAEHGVSLHELVLVRPATTLRTSSGKLQRNATRDAYVQGELDVIGVWREARHEVPVDAASSFQGWLAALVGAKLKVPSSRLDLHRPIAEYGLDSLTAGELIAAIEDKLGIELPFELLFVGDPSLATLADTLLRTSMSHAEGVAA